MTHTPESARRPSDARAAHDPEEGRAVRGQGEADDAPEIAADDAGASAMAERAGRQAKG